MLSSLLFLASAGQAPLALDRFSAYMKAADSLSVDCKVTFVGAPSATGRMLYQRPDRLFFTMKWDKSDYTFSSTERGILETEAETGRYDEWTAQTRLVAPQSRISMTPQMGFPAVLVYGDVRALFPRDARISFLGKEQFAGVEVDHVQAKFMTERGPGQTDAFIDGHGRLLKLGQVMQADEGQLVYAQEYSNYKINQKMALGAFLTTIPAGYVPHTLPAAARYLEADERFPEISVSEKGGSPKVLAYSGKGTLLAFTTPDCEVSARAAKTLGALREAALASGYRFIEISGTTRASDAKAFSGASDIRFDPSGKAWETLGVQGTPSLWLVNGKGTLVRYWFGFNPAGVDALVRSVKDELEGKSDEG